MIHKQKTSNKKLYFIAVFLFLGFLAWRMVRPLNIVVVSDDFATPMAITSPPPGLDSIHASECGECHAAIYREWSDSMHAQAWVDPYYQIDYIFDGSQQICLNCHIPLQNQQENLVLGFLDQERFKPVLQNNPNFDEKLQQEGVTCVVCHLRKGVIIGPYGDTDAPHPTRYDATMTDGIGVCRKCHVVSGQRWDTFFRIPPCGTVAEITEGSKNKEINCTHCHMPPVERPLVEGLLSRKGNMHLWKGGHDQETVRNALKVDLEIKPKETGGGKAIMTLTNIGADHFLPTGTPDRHLTVDFQLKDNTGNVLKSKKFSLKRTIMWRPFIIDLWDTRLVRGKSSEYVFQWDSASLTSGSVLEVTVRYHLLDEKRRKRIGYNNTEPISFELFKYNSTLNH